MRIPLPRHYLALCLAFLLPLRAAVATPLISEFMADNVATIADENGAFSDWIEIYNPDATAVNLNNWCLTDSAANLTKWRFPAVTLGPGEFLMVWASGTSKRIVGQPLHTSFSLSAGGEYLALVQADGTTIAHQFSPQYPSQDPDRSYGVSFNGTPLVVAGATARYRVPADSSIQSTWAGAGFADGSWANGPTGLGFGLLVPGITIREMRKNTAYGGMANLADADGLQQLSAGNPAIASETTSIRQTINFLGEGSEGEYPNSQLFPNGGGDYFCVKGTGFVTIPTAGAYTFGINTDDGGRIRIDGAELVVDDTLHGAQDHMATITLSAGTHSFEVLMFEQAGGDEFEFYAAPGTLTSWSSAFKLVGDTNGGGLAATTFPSGVTGGTGAIATNIATAMQNVRSACYVRVPFTASNVAGFTSLSLKMRYNDGFVAYLNGTEIARRNAPTTLAYNSAATATRTNTESLTTEAINVTAFLPQLANGANVLAIQGLNINAADGSFLVLPELVAGGLVGGAPVYFNTATPGSINGTPSSLGKVADTQFSTKRGVFTAPFNLAITTLTSGAEIRYTTDGSVPTATSGTIYTAPITISGTTVLRAAAFKAGWDSTNVDTNTYLFFSDVITQSAAGQKPGSAWPDPGTATGQLIDYGMDPDIVNSTNAQIGGATAVKNALAAIPSVSIVTPVPNLFDANTGIYTHAYSRGFAWERPCSVELIGDVGGGFQIDAGIRIRGGYSRDGGNPKHGFHLYFRSDYGPSKLKYPLFGHEGVDEFDQIDLRTTENYSWAFSGDTNQTFLREEGSREAQLAMGQPSSHCRYYHLYINGQYWGLYDTDERTEAGFAASYLGGKKTDYDTVKCEQDSNYTVGATDGTLDAWQDLWNKARAHAANPTNANYFKMMGRAADGITPTADPVLLDADNLIDYMLLTFWMGNEDGATSSFLGNDRANNWFGTRSRTGTRGFHFYAHDFEHSYGLPSGNVAVDRTGPFTSTNQSNFAYSNPMFLHQDLTGNLEYKTRFGDRVQKHLFNNGALTAGAEMARATLRSNIVDAAITAESARWGDAKSGTPLNRLNWQAARDGLFTSFIVNRGPNLISQLRTGGLFPSIDAPAVSPQFGGYIASGTEVIMSAATGTIYYTLDGTDPRLLGGGLNPAAQSYTVTTATDPLIPLDATWKYRDDGSNQGTAWRAAAFNDSGWSSGAAELGYGDGDEATIIQSGPAGAHYATTYFRKTFNVTNAAAITALAISLKHDDAAIIYLNGTRVVNSFIAPDALFSDYSGNSADENAFYDFTSATTAALSPSLLVNGNNTLAVEIHQSGGGSSDISFKLSLTGTRTTTTQPLYLTGNGVKTLRARARSGTNWSALDEALYLVNTTAATSANLAISQIMYHPADPSAAETTAGFTDAGMFEFLELMNLSAQSVDLDGLYFSDGIDFDFKNSLLGRVLAPGGRILLVANKLAFEARYGTGKPVAGEFNGSLNNAGEMLTLLNAAGTTVRSFAYSPLAPWPVEADTVGRSLVLKRPGTNPNPALPESWRASAAISGAPGVSDTQTYSEWKTVNGVTSDTADGDGDGLTNWMEFVLGGSVTANDSGRLQRTPGTGTFTVGGVPDLYATFTCTRRYAADDVNFTVQWSNDLAAWSTAGAVFVSATHNADNTETLLYRSALPRSANARNFFRARAVVLP